jgi:hypothetical protein
MDSLVGTRKFAMSLHIQARVTRDWDAKIDTIFYIDLRHVPSSPLYRPLYI